MPRDHPVTEDFVSSSVSIFLPHLIQKEFIELFSAPQYLQSVEVLVLGIVNCYFSQYPLSEL